MSHLYVVAGWIAVGLLCYLACALLWPERFE